MAKYTLDRFDDSNDPIEIDSSTTLQQSGLVWVGQYYSKFGEILLENMLNMTEHFAGPVQPSSKNDPNASFNNLIGQIWYSTNDEDHETSEILKVFNGNEDLGTDGWKRIEIIIKNSQPNTQTNGERWYNPSRQTLSISRNTTWEPLRVEDAYNSDSLKGVDGGNYLRKDIDDTLSGNLFSTNIYPNINGEYNLGDENSRWDEVHTNLIAANYSESLIPKEDVSYNLGTSDNRWNNLNVKRVVGNEFGDLIPISDESYVIGTSDLKWLTMYLKDAYIDRINNVMPIDSTGVIGSSSNRWNSGFFGTLNTSNVSSHLIPNQSKNLGSDDNPWNNLYVDILHDVMTKNLTPTNDVTYNLGSNTKRYNTIFAQKFSSGGAGLQFDGSMDFNIKRNERSNGINWKGLSDNHSIYVEEIANNEKTRLVISSTDNNEDHTVFKNNENIVMEVKRDEVKTPNTLHTNDSFKITDETSSNGMTMTYNNSAGCIEFKFV